jgi:hypothetical protein
LIPQLEQPTQDAQGLMQLGYLRLLKRRSSFEPGQDIQQIINNEFLYDGVPDLSLSVFEVNIQEKILQTNAEMAAGVGIRPPKRKAVDLLMYGSGWSDVVITPTTNGIMNFDFTSDAHRELKFESEMELNNFVKGLQSSVVSAPLLEIKDKDTAQYGNERYLANDPEWIKVCELSDQVAKWVTTGKP